MEGIEPDDLPSDREHSLLTQSQREYLLGDQSSSTSADRKKRQQIRDRIRSGLLDFAILTNNMDARDRRQLFAREQLKGLQTLQPERAFRTDEVRGAIHTLAFLYATLIEMNADFEEYLTEAIAIAHKQILDSPWDVRDIDVRILDEPDWDLERLCEILEKDEELTDREYSLLLRLSNVDTGQFLEATSDVKIDIENALTEEEPLSRGRSLIAFARGLSQADWLNADEQVKIFDEQVLRNFGISAYWISERVKGEATEGDEMSSEDSDVTPTPKDVADEL